MRKQILRNERDDLDPRSSESRPGSGAGERAGFATTLAVHAGREDLRPLGVHALPIDLSSTYPVIGVDEAAASLDSMAAGGRPVAGQAVYSRLHNPTVDRFERALARLEGAEQAVAFASGMATVTACLMAAPIVAREAGRLAEGETPHVVAVRPLYGGTDHVLSHGLLGLRTTWTTADRVAEAIEPSTVLVVIETPANPTLDLVDIAAVASQAGAGQVDAAHGDAAAVDVAAGVPVLVDSTFATPVLQRPLALGATLSLHSATKFLGGHGDVLAGVVATSDPAWAAALRQVRVLTGGVLHPLAAYLLHRGLQTLPVRVESAQRGARYLAERLDRHEAVASVSFPSLPGCDPDGLLGRQMDGPGTMITFELRPDLLAGDGDGFRAAARTLAGLELITPAVSLGSTDTLIQHPAAMTHRVVSEEGRAAGGISASMLRLSVGLEHPEDLWHDLGSALDSLVAGPASAGDETVSRHERAEAVCA